MSEPSFQDDVLGELGDDQLTEIAGLLGTDANGARETVAETVGAMTGDLQQKADADDADGVRCARPSPRWPSHRRWRAWPRSAAAWAACSAAA